MAKIERISKNMAKRKQIRHTHTNCTNNQYLLRTLYLSCELFRRRNINEVY